MPAVDTAPETNDKSVVTFVVQIMQTHPNRNCIISRHTLFRFIVYHVDRVPVQLLCALRLRLFTKIQVSYFARVRQPGRRRQTGLQARPRRRKDRCLTGHSKIICRLALPHRCRRHRFSAKQLITHVHIRLCCDAVRDPTGRGL